MSVNFKDYYAILGISKSATPDEIKRAYRTLARQHHPDKASEANKHKAEQKIKEINEAYAVLKDSEKRAQYDQLGSGWSPNHGFGGGRRQAGPGFGTAGDGADFHFGGTGFSDFFEQYFGSRRSAFSRNSGIKSKGRDIESDISVTLEEVAHGSDRQISCKRTNPDTGEVTVEQYRLKIPVGVKEGQKMRLAGKGQNASIYRNSGDLFLKVRYAPHPEFRYEDGRLYYDLNLSPWEAVLGDKVEIPTLYGSIRMNIKPGTSSGTQLRVKGKGLPTKEGIEDLYVAVHIKVPADLTSAEMQEWQKIKELSRFNPRA